MNELNLFWDDKPIAKLLTPAVPMKGNRLAFNDMLFHVQEVTMEFEQMGNAYVLKTIKISGWPLP